MMTVDQTSSSARTSVYRQIGDVMGQKTAIRGTTNRAVYPVSGLSDLVEKYYSKLLKFTRYLLHDIY